MTQSTKPRVFISYAHKDGMEFTRRFAYALGFYADVFWDIHLQSGEYPLQLEKEIESRNYFVLVMSPYSLASEWCRRELQLAQTYHNNGIALARIYNTSPDTELAKQYTYGDFSTDFEVGFRRITQLVTGHPYSSWEIMSQAQDAQIFQALQHGHLPTLIAKELAEWLNVGQLWPQVEEYAASKTLSIFRGIPRTPQGVLRQCSILTKQFSENRDNLGVHLVKQAREVADIFVKELASLPDNNHLEAGEISFSIMTDVKEVLNKNAVAFRNVYETALIQYGYFDFDAAEKIRELINLHARRSRYLY